MAKLENTLSNLARTPSADNAESRLFELFNQTQAMASGDAYRDAGKSARMVEGIRDRNRDRYGIGTTARGQAQESRLGMLDLALGRTQATSDSALQFGQQQRGLLQSLLGFGAGRLGEGLQTSMFGERLAEQARQRAMKNKLASQQRKWSLS